MSRATLACLRIQLTLTFPLKSILWRTSSVSTSWGISWIIPNWRMTRSGECFSIMWKHTSGTVTVHTALPATHHGGRSFNSASYGCHTTYNSQKTSTQHIRQQRLYFKIHQTYKIVSKHVKQGIFILVLATLKLFARDTCPWRCGRAYFSCLGPTTTYNNQEQGINI